MVLGALATACVIAPPPARTATAPATPEETVMADGKPVTLEGRAANAKAGAILLTDDGDAIYLEGLDSWPDTVNGKRVRATGILRHEKIIPDPDTGPLKSAGAFGDQTILENPTWQPL